MDKIFTFGMIVQTALVAVMGTLLIVKSIDGAIAQVMQSTNYRIVSDSVNVGGVRATSTNYTVEDTAGEIATGEATSTNYTLRAGYQQMQEVYLALTAPANVSMSPAIGGVTGGTANGFTSFTATTDSLSGYQVTITASSSPALQSGSNTIADYVPTGAVPDFTFSTDTTDAHFGFTTEGTAIPARFKDTGAGVCGAGTGDVTLACWDGLSTTPIVVAEESSSNHPVGTETTLRFRTGIGSFVTQAPGTYVATTTLTLLPR